MKKLAILGSTGSIGVSVLEVVAEFPERFSVVALTAGSNLSRLEQQIRNFRPAMVAVRTHEDALKLRSALDNARPEIVIGVEGLMACAAHPEAQMTVSAIVG